MCELKNVQALARVGQGRRVRFIPTQINHRRVHSVTASLPVLIQFYY